MSDIEGLIARLHDDAFWHDTAVYGGKISSDEMRDSAKIEREAAEALRALQSQPLYTLEQLREPSEAAVKAGSDRTQGYVHASMARDIWQAMLDAAIRTAEPEGKR